MSGASEGSPKSLQLPSQGHLVVIGQSGLGKSSLVKAMTRRASLQAEGSSSRILVIDAAAEYGAVAVGVSSYDQWVQYTSCGAPWCVAYQAEDLDEYMPEIAYAMMQLEPCTLVVEEADMWCSPHKVDAELAKTIKYGRKHAVWVWSIFRYHAEVHPLLRSQARHFISFGHSEPAHLDYVRGATTHEVAEIVTRLDPLQCVWYDRHTRQTTLLQVDPRALTIRRLARLDRKEAQPVA